MFGMKKFAITAKVVPLAAAAILGGCALASKPVKMAPAEPAAPATKMVMKTVVLDARTLFAFDSAELTSEGKARLDRLISEAGGKAAGNISITGHTDRIGPEDYNMGLSQRRAESVAGYMTQRGVPESAITTYAKGETEPEVQCEDQPWRALVECLQPNRRVVVQYPTQVEEEVVVDD